MTFSEVFVDGSVISRHCQMHIPHSKKKRLPKYHCLEFMALSWAHENLEELK